MRCDLEQRQQVLRQCFTTAEVGLGNDRNGSIGADYCPAIEQLRQARAGRRPGEEPQFQQSGASGQVSRPERIVSEDAGQGLPVRIVSGRFRQSAVSMSLHNVFHKSMPPMAFTAA